MKSHVLCSLVICNFLDDALICQSEVNSLEVEWLYNSFQCILILRAWYASKTFFVNIAIQKKKNKQDCILSSACILWPRLFPAPSSLPVSSITSAFSLHVFSREFRFEFIKGLRPERVTKYTSIFFSTRNLWFYHKKGSHCPSLICFSSLRESPYQRGQKWF